MRIRGDDALLDAVLKAGHDGQHDDQGAHPQKDTADPDPDEERQVRALPARPEIPQ